MKLVLELLGPPRLMGARRRCELNGGSLSIGRSPEAGWVIPDSERMISRHHLRVDSSHGEFILTDTSANGVYVNGGAAPVGYGASIKLRDGDRLLLGEAQIAVSVTIEEPLAGSGPPPSNQLPPRPALQVVERDPLGGPFGAAERPSGPPAAQASGAGSALRGGVDANWMIKPIAQAPMPVATPTPFNGRNEASTLRPVPALADRVEPGGSQGLSNLVDAHPDLSARQLAAAVDRAAHMLDPSARSAFLAEINRAVELR